MSTSDNYQVAGRTTRDSPFPLLSFTLFLGGRISQSSDLPLTHYALKDNPGVQTPNHVLPTHTGRLCSQNLTWNPWKLGKYSTNRTSPDGPSKPF